MTTLTSVPSLTGSASTTVSVSVSPKLNRYDNNSYSNDKQILRNRSFKLSDFTVGKKLGRGKFGKVYVVRCNASGYICAMKVLWKYQLRKNKN